MSSAKRDAANRRNAKKSTGPRTPAGKKASALNAIRHAVLAGVPVLPGVERLQEWEAHRAATVSSLGPFGYFETALADRVALLLWRLGRVTRYETENTASKLEMAEADLAGMFLQRVLSAGSGTWGRSVTGSTPAQIQEDIEARTTIAVAFAELRECEPDGPVAGKHASAVLLEVADRCGLELDEVSLPMPAEAEEVGWEHWTGWSKALVFAVVAAVVAASKYEACRDAGPDEIFRECGARAEADLFVAKLALPRAEAELQRHVRARMLLRADELDSLARYEAHLERSLLRTLHELQRLQEARSGNGRAPMAIDLDVTTGPRMPEPETVSPPVEP